MKKTAQEPKVTENPLYHDTWMLLRKYRDVVWSLELSVQQVRRQFQIEYGSSIHVSWYRGLSVTLGSCAVFFIVRPPYRRASLSGAI